MSRSIASGLVLILFVFVCNSSQDVSHVFAQTPEFHYFQHRYHQQHPVIPHFQSGVSTLYAPPAVVADNEGDFVKPVAPSEISTPAPVAPVSTSSEFLLPEIVENRSAKGSRNFIPLFKQYLPPVPPPVLDERPNYESPQQGNQQYDPFNGGYIYQKPAASTTTTTTKPVQANNDPNALPPINNDPIESSPAQGYNYHIPSTPTTIIVAADTPFNEPISTPAPVYLPTSKDQQFSGSQNSDNTTPLRLHVHEMRCLPHQSPTRAYFKAILKIDNFLSAFPSVDNDSSDKRCQLKFQKSYVIVDITGEDFARCGVQQCGSDLCLRLRFPAIRGMRTASDNILSLHCKSQTKVAVKTHALKMGISNEVQARSIGTYAKGGTQNSFRTHIELLRKTDQSYTKYLKANEPVQLGEDLILRAHVLTGDGWNYTKLTDVNLQRISPSGEMLNNVQLITSLGCLNPSMKSICAQMPTFDAPLGHKFHFKAVMFQGMKSGEELILSMRITGCLEYHDCYIDNDQCNQLNVSHVKRRKRDMLSTAPHNQTGEASEISKIAFRVIMPEEKSFSQHDYIPENFKTQTKSIVVIASLGFVALCLFTCLAIYASTKFRKH